MLVRPIALALNVLNVAPVHPNACETLPMLRGICPSCDDRQEALTVDLLRVGQSVMLSMGLLVARSSVVVHQRDLARASSGKVPANAE